MLTPNSLSLCALLTIVENIELENTLKHSISADDRLTFIQNSLTGIRAPASSGFSAACVANMSSKLIEDSQNSSGTRKMSNSSSYKPRDSNRKLKINRMKVSPENLPTPDELRLTRIKKRIIQQSVDLFNTSSPAKSIQFLKDNCIFSNEPNIYMQQLIKYLKETSTLDKKVLEISITNMKILNFILKLLLKPIRSTRNVFKLFFIVQNL